MPTFPFEILLAFVGGLLTVASPCTLPIVPVVLAIGATGGRRRLLGLLAGFSAVFVVATVLIAGAFAAAGLTTSGLRTIAAVALAAAGLLLAWPALGERLIRLWTAVRRPAVPTALPREPGPGSGSGGFATGLVAGTSTGLLWAPCTGPIMAGVIVNAAVEGPSLLGLSIASAYVLGASLALACIAVIGARTVRRFAVAGRHLRRGFGVALLVSALVLDTGWSPRLDLSVPVRTSEAILDSDADAAPVPLDDLGPAPELSGISAWLNGDATTMAALRGKVVLVQFWTFGCINCQHVLPYVRAWDAAYREGGLVVIGVHTPELSFERDLANVRKAVQEEGIRYPVAVDPDYRTWRAYDNHYWPAFYFVDRSGHIRHAHAGEGDYAGSEQVIRQLLAEDG